MSRPPRYITVTPAYGRDYKTPEAALADWDKGRDFKVEDPEFGGYVSSTDEFVAEHPEFRFTIRYDKGRHTVNVPSRGES